MDKSNKIIIALDVEEIKQAKRLVSELFPLIRIFKVGISLFTSTGPPIIKFIREKGADIFLDLKFHDIPHTVSKASESATIWKARFFTVHTGGGVEMMRAAKEGARKKAKELKVNPPLILGVTILTSMDEKRLKEEWGVRRTLKNQVVHLARLAKEAGLDGVVCSPQEIEIVRETVGKKILIVTPGVRPLTFSKDDQARTMTPEETLGKGADYIVIGRPVTHSLSPLKAVKEIIPTL